MVRVVECVKCDEAERFDSWPYEDSEDDQLDQLIRSEGWTFKGGDEYCPTCSEGDDDE